ncbi:hypothetical protein D3C77_471530 [compost metagenome]
MESHRIFIVNGLDAGPDTAIKLQHQPLVGIVQPFAFQQVVMARQKARTEKLRQGMDIAQNSLPLSVLLTGKRSYWPGNRRAR